jgi:3-hydroxybutyryl-CoA dehydrogenase
MIDALEAIADSMYAEYAEYAEPLHAVLPLLRRMTEAGLLGRKAGRGFYNYTD